MHRLWKGLFGGLAVAAVLVALGACSDDDADKTPSATATTTTASATAEATTAPTEAATATPTAAQTAGLSADFCSALLTLDQFDSPGGEESEDEYVAAIKTYADQVEGPISTMRERAPTDLGAALTTLADVVTKMHDGDIAAFESPETSEAIEAVETAAREGCGWETVTVTAADYSFTPDRDTLAAGPISFKLTNTGQEPHVFLLLRKQDGDTRADDEIVGDFLEKATSGEEAQLREVVDEMVQGGGPFALPGTSGSHALDLSAGTYIYWCPIPQGETGDGPPHFMLGMIGELAVN